jgi:hypothetical protein
MAPERIGRRPCSPLDDAQKSVIAHRDHQPCGEGGGRATAEGEAKMMDKMVKTLGSPG